MLKLVLEILGAVAVVAIAAVMGLQVFMRYVMNQSLPWPDELIGNMLAALTFIGAALAMRDDEHIRVRLLESLLSVKKALAVRVLADVVSIWFLLTVAWVSWPIVQRMWRFDLTTLPVPVGIFMITVPISCVIMSIYLIRNTFLHARNPAEDHIAEERIE